MQIFVFGDSIAYGASDTQASGWVDRLKAWANQRNETHEDLIAVFNLGIPGEDTAHMLERFIFETEQRFDARKQAFFIFAYGANDAATYNATGKFKVGPKDYAANLEKVLAQAKSFSVKIVCLTITPVIEPLVNDPRYADKTRLNENVEMYNGLIETVCRAMSVDVVDVYRIFSQGNVGTLLSEDGLHPNSAGHGVIFDTMKQYLEHKIES